MNDTLHTMPEELDNTLPAKHYDVETIDAMQEAFFREPATGDKPATLADVAIEFGIPKKVVLYWANRRGWLQIRADLVKTEAMEADLQYKEFLIENKRKVAQHQLDMTSDLDAQIRLHLDAAKQSGTPMSASDIKRMAESMSSTATIAARAAAISDKADPFIEIESGSGRAGNKVQLILLGVQPRKPSGPTEDNVGKTVNVEESWVHEEHAGTSTGGFTLRTSDRVNPSGVAGQEILEEQHEAQ